MTAFPLIRAPLRDAWVGGSKDGVRRTSMDAGPSKSRVDSKAVGVVESFQFKLNDTDAGALETHYESDKALRFDLDHWVWGDCEARYAGPIKWGHRGRWKTADVQLEIFRGAPAVPVSPPSGFTWTPPYTISRLGVGAASTFVTNFDFDASKPAVNGTIYVDSTAGNNANTGLSRAQAVRSLSTAITKANALAVAVVRLLVRPGHYFRFSGGSTLDDHFNGVTPSCNLIIEPDDFYSTADVFVWSNHAATISFTLFSGAIYKATGIGTTNNRVLLDRAKLDGFGDATGLKRVNSPANTANPAAELNAAWADGRGAYYYNAAAGELFVRLFDDRAPDANLVVCSGAAAQLSLASTATRKIWLDRIHINGGGQPLRAVGVGVAHEIYARLSSFCGGSDSIANGGCVSLVDGPTRGIFDRCQAKYGLLDGFNYHGVSSPIAEATSPTAMEIDCVSRHNGEAGGGANNASTAHEAARVISVNGVYEYAQDRTIHDIQSAQRWMLGSTVRAPVDTASVDGVMRLGNDATQATKAWLDAVRVGAVTGSQFTFDILAAAQLRYANMDPTGWVTPGAGSIASYTP